MEHIRPTGTLTYRADIIYIAIPAGATPISMAERTLLCNLGNQYSANALTHRAFIVDLSIAASTPAVSVAESAGFWSIMNGRLNFIGDFHKEFGGSMQLGIWGLWFRWSGLAHQTLQDQTECPIRE